MTDLTRAELEELAALEARATKGEWSTAPSPFSRRSVWAQGAVDTYAGPVWGSIISCLDTDDSDFEGREWQTSGSPEANAALIVASRNALPALIVLAREALEARERIRRDAADYARHQG